MNKKLRFMWMLLLTFVCSTIWAEKYEYGNEKKYSKVSFAATTDASETNVLTKGGITLTRSKGTWEAITPMVPSQHVGSLSPVQPSRLRVLTLCTSL